MNIARCDPKKGGRESRLVWRWNGVACPTALPAPRALLLCSQGAGSIAPEHGALGCFDLGHGQLCSRGTGDCTVLAIAPSAQCHPSSLGLWKMHSCSTATVLQH